MKIRPYAPADRGAALELAITIWRPVFDGMRKSLPRYVFDSFYPKGWEVRQRDDVGALLDSGDGPAWVAERAGALAGILIAAAREEDRMGEIVVLGTHPDHHRNGIAKALTDTALHWMREQGLAFAMAETGGDPGHAPARAAYEALHFEPWPVVRYVRKL